MIYCYTLYHMFLFLLLLKVIHNRLKHFSNCGLKMQSTIWFCKLLFWSQKPIILHPFRAAEATCWLAGTVYSSVRATMFVSHFFSHDRVQTKTLFLFFFSFCGHTEEAARGPGGGMSWIWQKECVGLELRRTAPLTLRARDDNCVSMTTWQIFQQAFLP